MSTKILKIYKKIPGPVYGYLSIIAGLIGDLFAIILFPGFNLSYMISALGAGPGGIFFNLGLILSGLFALGFYPYLIKTVQASKVHSKLLKFAKFTSIISCIFYSLIGLFPAIVEFDLLVNLHGLSATISWISALMYLSAFGILFLKSTNFMKIHSILSFATAITFLVVLLTWNPITEWIMTIAIISWIAIVATYTLVKKF